MESAKEENQLIIEAGGFIHIKHLILYVRKSIIDNEGSDTHTESGILLQIFKTQNF